jgi:hypothetical protein
MSMPFSCAPHELLCQITGCPGLQLAWRPPTKNADQIERYKLMMSSSTGVVRELAHGKFLRFLIGGLRPATEYVFCVKAIYTDGSYLWSESRAFKTTPPGKRGG